MEALKVFGCVFEQRTVISRRYMESQRGKASRLKRADVALEEEQWRKRRDEFEQVY